MTRATRPAHMASRPTLKPSTRDGLGRPFRTRRGTWIFGICGLISVAAVGAALVSQYAFQMDPCPWCVLQRIVFLAIAVVCAVGVAWRTRSGRWVAALFGVLLGLSGIASSLWQHFVAAKAASCVMTLADKIITATQLDTLLPDVFSPRASCADAAVDLLGVPYDFWSLAVFAVVTLMLLALLFERRPR